MKIVITVKDTDNVIGLKEDIAMRLEGVADIVRIDTADVAPKSEVAREIMQEARQVLLNMVLANSIGETYDIEKRFAEIENKYTEET